MRHLALPVYCSAGQLERLAPSLRAHLPDAELTADWTRFERRAALSDCAVVVADDLGDVVERLVAFRRRLPFHPIVLVTHNRGGNLPLIARLSVDELVWSSEACRELPRAVRRARAAGPLEQLARELEGAAHLGPQLRAALVHACRSPDFVPDVAGLVRPARCHRSTLNLQWRAATRGADLRLQDFLGWIVLVRAVERRTPGRKWSAIADELRVHPHTLHRTAARLLGHPLREAAEGGYGRLLERFRAAVSVLLEPSSL